LVFEGRVLDEIARPTREEPAMPSDQGSVRLVVAVQTLAVRQAVQIIGPQEALRSLSRPQIEEHALAIHARVTELNESRAMTAIPQVDEVLAVEVL
jgi:hypothetical protein